MATFEKTRWADNRFVQDYRDDASTYLPYRTEFFRIALAYLHHFLANRQPLRILDLGCGDGLFVQEVLQTCEVKEVVLVDGSPQMVASAAERLGSRGGVEFIEGSFQELVTADPLAERKFDFVFSSLAIHHLPLKEKGEIYGYIFNHLDSRGHFLHYDVVLGSTHELEKWNMSLWRRWIQGDPDKDAAERLQDIPGKYKANSDNIPDTLDSHLDALKEWGFAGVDCFFKYGAFALFGGYRP